MHQRAIVALITVTAIAIGAFAYLRINSVEWSAPALADRPLWNEEEVAAYGPKVNGPASPVGAVKRGETLQVIRDRYGKDYWACYVEAESGGRGWVLCKDVGSKPLGT